tara:strand:+ start:847 stop:1053 length:207 start_codon:yes stop_codon:yes gene_type:complete
MLISRKFAKRLSYLLPAATPGEKVVTTGKVSKNQKVVHFRDSVKGNLSWIFSQIKFIELPYLFTLNKI